MTRIAGAVAELRGISHHPELAYREHAISQSGGQASNDLIDNYAGHAQVFRVHTWVRKAVTVIANNIAPLAVTVVDANNETVENHDITNLFAMPNDTQSQAEFWEEYTIHMMLGGEAFIEVVTNEAGTIPLEVWLRRPDQVGVRPDDSTERKLFPTVAGYNFGDDEHLIEPQNMHHSMFTHPLNPWRGLAPISALRSALVIDMFASAWSQKFLKSGARPDYAIVAPQGITPSEREKIEADLAIKFGGTENAHKPLVLEDGITDIKTFSYPPVDIQWLEQRKFSRDEIGAVYGVPDEVMGYGRDTYENMDAAHRWLWLLTLIPFLQRRDDGLTKYFTLHRPMLQPGQRVHTDLANIAALQEDILPKVDAATKLWALGVPFNTLNEQLKMGFPEIVGGDIGYLPFNLFPVGENMRASAGASAQAQPQSAPVVPETIAVSPVSGANGSNDSNTGRDSKDSEAEQLRRLADAHTAIEYGGDQHKQQWDTWAAQVSPHEKRMQRHLKREFQRQQNEVLRALREILTERGINHDTVKTQQPIPSVDEVFNVRAEITHFQLEFEPGYVDAVGDFGGMALQDLGLGISFDVTDPFVQGQIDQMSFKFANDINRNTQKMMGEEIRLILGEAAEEGWSISTMQNEIYDRVSTVFDVRKSDYETERIARTEMNRAANDGVLEGWRQSNVVEGKAWLAALDGRTRATHIEAHDFYQLNPVPLDMDFDVGGCSGFTPGLTGCPEEDINCRCTMISVIVGERAVDGRRAVGYPRLSKNGGQDVR
jgi:HK97 family phage portal protein